MRPKKAASRSLSLFLLFLFPVSCLASVLQVHFIDVGQGDSIFIETPKEKKILIDAGSHSKGNDPRNPFHYLKEKFKAERTFFVVISANSQDGPGRRYKHPHQETLETLEKLQKIRLYRTDLHGSTVFSTVPGQLFHGGLIFRSDGVATEDLEFGMTPVGEHGDHVYCNSHFGQKHLEDSVPEDRPQQIKEVVFTKALPKGLVGKMLKKELRKLDSARKHPGRSSTTGNQ
jgi:hypothetical protein